MCTYCILAFLLLFVSCFAFSVRAFLSSVLLHGDVWSACELDRRHWAFEPLDLDGRQVVSYCLPSLKKSRVIPMLLLSPCVAWLTRA